MAGLQRAPRIPPEDDEGSVEYKWRLSPQSLVRLEGLTTQMKFRLGEGGGVCWYYIGYRDDGEPKGLLQSELDSSLATLVHIACSVGASVRVKEVFRVESRPKTKKLADPASNGDGCLLYTALCEVTSSVFTTIPLASPVTSHWPQTHSRFLGRVAFVGLSGVGKTTLIGALVSESRDDGRGSLRFSTSKLVHEVLNGGTTCAATPHLLDLSSGRIELLDLPAVSGKYRKTLFKSLVSKPIDLIVAVHAAAVSGSLRWLNRLKVPILDVVSKADIAQGGQNTTERLHVSTVTGYGLDELKRRIVATLEEAEDLALGVDAEGSVVSQGTWDDVIMSVDSSWTKAEMVVVGGVLESGKLRKGSTLRLQSGRVSEPCRVRDVRDEGGAQVEEFAKIGRYCTVGIEKFPSHQMEEPSTATSSAGEFLLHAVQRAVRPPLMLASEVLRFGDTVHVDFPGEAEICEGPCLVYWRGNRQEARLAKSEDSGWVIQLRKPGYVPDDAKLVVELASRLVYVALHRPS